MNEVVERDDASSWAQRAEEMDEAHATPGRLALSDVPRFLTAGRAVLTLESAATGTRFTYRVRRVAFDGKPEPFWFVDLLTGPDNVGDYAYVGRLLTEGRLELKLTGKSRLTADAPSVKAFAYLLAALNHGWAAESLRVWHEGRCGRCGRALTVPESIATGLGPVCAGREAR